MKKPLPSAYYVYTLAHPDGTVFYVGKGTKDRIGDHQRNARKGVQSYTCNTIRKIWSADCQVLQTKVAFFDSEGEAYQFESHLIAFFGRENLTNLTDGGEGGGGAPVGNKNAKKDGRTRVSVVISFSDDLLAWAIDLVRQEQGIADPTEDDIRCFMRKWLYARIDEEMKEKGFV